MDNIKRRRLVVVMVNALDGARDSIKHVVDIGRVLGDEERAFTQPLAEAAVAFGKAIMAWIAAAVESDSEANGRKFDDLMAEAQREHEQDVAAGRSDDDDDEDEAAIAQAIMDRIFAAAAGAKGGPDE